MYLDRRLPDDLLALLLPGGALAWLVPWLASPVAASALGHVQTRRDRGNRKRGSIQVYIGRTSPLDVRAGPRGRLRLHADVAYRKLTYGVFDRDVTVKELGDLRADLETHLEIAAALGTGEPRPAPAAPRRDPSPAPASRSRTGRATGARTRRRTCEPSSTRGSTCC